MIETILGIVGTIAAAALLYLKWWYARKGARIDQDKKNSEDAKASEIKVAAERARIAAENERMKDQREKTKDWDGPMAPPSG